MCKSNRILIHKTLPGTNFSNRDGESAAELSHQLRQETHHVVQRGSGIGLVMTRLLLLMWHNANN